jgi:hypothetical protein
LCGLFVISPSSLWSSTSISETSYSDIASTSKFCQKQKYIQFRLPHNTKRLYAYITLNNHRSPLTEHLIQLSTTSTKTTGWQSNIKFWPAWGQHGRRDVTSALLLQSIFIRVYYVVSLYKMATASANARSVTRNPTTPSD